MARSCSNGDWSSSRERSPAGGSFCPSSERSACATATPCTSTSAAYITLFEYRLDSRIARSPGSARRLWRGLSPAPFPCRARCEIALASSVARAELSSRLTLASRARCSTLSTTTTAPTIDVTPRTCLPLMPRRMSRCGMRSARCQVPHSRGGAAAYPDARRTIAPSHRHGSASFALLGAQPQLVQLVVQRLEADAEDLRSARLVVPRVRERHHDQPAF